MKTMKYLVTFLLVLFTTAAFSQRKVDQDFKKLKWLSGNWARVNNKKGQIGKESWAIVSASKLAGKGFTLQGADTVFIEHLTLEIKGNDIYYIVNTPQNPKPTLFKITSIIDNYFSCENPEHDFPKKIAYTRNGNHIKATISGDGKSIDFLFTKNPF